MHEMSLAQNILEIVQDTMSREKLNGPGKLREVAVQVGELVAVVPESLEFCFNVLTENTEPERCAVENRNIASYC